LKPHPILTTLLLGAGLLLVVPRAGSGQAPFPGGQADVNKLAHEMAERVRHLGEDISSDLAQAPEGRHLIDDTKELGTAIDEFHETLHDRPDPARVGQAFAGIDQTWQHLRGQLSRPGMTSPAVDRAARRVDELAARIRQSLNLNAPPPAFYGNGAAPAGLADTQRLAHALVDRARALAGVVQVDMAGDPNGPAFARDAVGLAQIADTFHDSIDANQPIEVAARAFAPVDEIADRVERFVTSGRVSPRVQQAWQAFASVEVLIHQNLGLGSPQPAVQYTIAPRAGGPSPMVALSVQLVEQVNAFMATYGPNARNVPEGGIILAQARRLQEDAADFQQHAARGLPPNRLAHEFRDVDDSWQRLSRHIGRVARGWNGPVIQQVQAIGGTCEQIHRVLGMPGYPPTLIGPVGAVPPPPPDGAPFR